MMTYNVEVHHFVGKNVEGRREEEVVGPFFVLVQSGWGRRRSGIGGLFLFSDICQTTGRQRTMQRVYNPGVRFTNV
jgi:hypothetical protein